MDQCWKSVGKELGQFLSVATSNENFCKMETKLSFVGSVMAKVTASGEIKFQKQFYIKL